MAATNQKDVFQKKIVPTEAWSLDGVLVTLSDGNDKLLVSQVDIAYQRSSVKIRPLNQDKNIVIIGPGAGTVTLAIIVGPCDGLKAFLTQYSDPCQISKNVMDIKSHVTDECTSCNGEGVTTFKCSDVLSNQLRVTVTGGQGGNAISMINASIGFEIGALVLE